MRVNGGARPQPLPVPQDQSGGAGDRVSADGKAGEQASDQRSYSFRFSVQIQRSSELNSHGLNLTSQIPILVQDVTAEYRI
ncbi:hypothetical protein CRUP_019252 [Coryphaenoides rupestris]|nr:hypothetical protein CRUP_019252 [Coryphaenoides rupestris]